MHIVSNGFGKSRESDTFDIVLQYGAICQSFCNRLSIIFTGTGLGNDNIDEVEQITKKQEEAKAKQIEEIMEAKKQREEAMDCSDLNNNTGITGGQDDIMKGDDIIYDVTYPKIFAVKGNDPLKRRDACVYCGNLEHKLSPHLLSLPHRAEKEISEIFAINAKTQEGSHRKARLLQVLKYKGNYLHNRRVIQQKAGQFLPFQKFKLEQKSLDISQFAPCPNCKGYVNIATLERHFIECPAKAPLHAEFSSLKDMEIEKSEVTHTKSPTSPQPPHVSQSNTKPTSTGSDTDFKLADDLISTIPVGEVSRIAKRDKLIRELSKMWADRHVGNRQLQPVYVSCMNRLLARFVMALRQLTNSPSKDLQGLITPDNSQHMDPAISQCFPLGRDVESDLRDLPYGTRLQTELKRLLSLQVGYAIISVRAASQLDACHMEALLVRRLGYKLYTPAVHVLPAEKETR